MLLLYAQRDLSQFHLPAIDHEGQVQFQFLPDSKQSGRDARCPRA